VLNLTVRPGGVGEDGWLRQSKDGLSRALDLEMIVVEGPYAKRKLWSLLTLGGTTQGHAEAGAISKARLRAILESARGVRPDDRSEQAAAARRITSFSELDGIRFIGKIGIEPGRGEYQAKNTVAEIITPERAQWHPVVQAPIQTKINVPAPANSIERPAWAQ
jgi:hypothetical protein